MGTLWSVLMGITLLAALGVIGLILMQQGKGADLGASMGGGGGGASGSVFGASGSSNFLSRSTSALAAVFFICTLALAYLGQSKNRANPVQAETTLEQQQEQQNISVLDRLQNASGAAATATVGAGSATENANASSAPVAQSDGGTSVNSASADNTSAADGTYADSAVASDGKRFAVEPGVLSVFFDSGKSAVTAQDLPQDVLQVAELKDAVDAGKTLFVSGYVDSTGSAEVNKELAKNRAVAVRDTLVALGVPSDKIELQKPDAIELGDGAQARRVEVRVK